MSQSQNMVTTPAVTATGTLKRTVHDQIRRLNTVVSPFLALVKEGNVDNMGEMSYKNGYISKQKTDTMKFEWFTYTPIDIYSAATAGTTSTVDIADTSMFRTRDIITNLSNLQVAIVREVTSGTRLTVTAVGSWDAPTAGDIIAMSCRTVEEGTSDITPLTKEPDNNYNYVFPFRYSVSVADTALNSPHYGGDLLKRYMTDNLTFTLRNLENAFHLGKRAASGDSTSVTIGGTAYSLFTTRGLLDYATNPIDMGGTVTIDKLNTKVFQELPSTINPERILLMFCGKKIYGSLMSLAAQKLIYMESGEKDTFGVRATKFYCGAYTIKPVLHDLYDQGSLQTQAVVFDPEDLTYMFKAGMDIATKDNLQLPATWGTTRAVQGVVGLRCLSGGANVRLITNWTN